MKLKIEFTYIKRIFFYCLPFSVAAVFLLTTSLANAIDVCNAISSNTTWTLGNSPYVLKSGSTGCTVTVNAGVTLTIQAGVQVKGLSASNLVINGTLSAIGTSGSPILFTTNSTTPAPGQWGGLRFGTGAGPSASQLTYATVSYAGNQASFPGAVYINGSSPTFNNATVSFSSRNGIYITGSTATPTFSSGTVSNNTLYGINLVSSGGLNITNSAISNNTDYAFGAEPNTRLLGLTGLTITGNGTGNKNSIGYRTGTITTNETWRSPVVWTITGMVNIGSAGILTVQAGTMVKFAAGAGIDVTGKLTAVGTTGSQITFTSNAASPAPGNWNYIKFNSGANPSASQIAYSTISYAGQSASVPAAIHITGSSPTLNNLTISLCSKSGLVVSGSTATPSVNNATVTSNSAYGVNLISSGGINLTNSTISNNIDYAIGAEANTRLTGLTGLTLTGNGSGNKNSIGYRGGSITTNETWRIGAIWTVTTTATVGSAGTLTVNAGVTVKFASNTGIDVTGKLTAVGTSGNLILFTSNSATPGPGNWRAIRFRPGSNPTSQISYATISYGGSTYSAGIHIDSCSPTLSNITVSNSSGSGIVSTASSATPLISNSTLTNNSLYGLNLISSGGANLSTTVISNNADYAVYVSDTARLLGLTGLTITGNGGGSKDAIAYEGRSISGNEILGGGIVSVLLDGFYIEQTGILTIYPGAVIRLSGISFQIAGKLTAVGTAASPIVFTSNNTTPAPGDWEGILFWPTTDPTSTISYATISYGGWGAVLNIDGSSPKIDHVSILHSLNGALDVTGMAAPTITNCSFVDNVSGLSNQNPSNVIIANLNYWNSSSGPSGAGSGSGQSVSTGVVHSPWLVAPASDPHFFKSTTISKFIFDPSVGQTTTIAFETSLVGNWTLKIFNINNSLVRTFSGTGATGNVVWNGTNGSGQMQPNGAYGFDLESTSASYIATKAHGVITIGELPVVNTLTANPYYFTPNGDLQNDTTTINASFNYSNATWTLNIKNSGGTIVRSTNGNGSSMSFVWDGKNSSQVLQPDGIYTIELVATAEGAQTTSSVAVTLDTSGRTSYILAPYPGQVLSNVYAWFVDVICTVNETNLDHWTLEIGNGPSPSSWNILASGNTNVSNQSLYSLPVIDYVNGVYSLRLVATRTDLSESIHSIVVTIGNFKAEGNVMQINRVTNQFVTITSYVPFKLNETLTIKDINGQIIKTLFSGQRLAGTYNDTWNGTNQQGQALPDGMHFFQAVVTSGQSNLVWGATSDTSTEWIWSHTVTGTSDPFNNQLLAMPYFFWYPGKSTTFTFGTECWFDPVTGWHIVPGCDPPNFCVTLDGYRESGNHTFYWSGTDQEGRFRDDVCGWAVIRLRSVDWNMVLAYGTKPMISSLQINPPLYAPSFGTQTVSFSFTTYQNQNATLTVEFLNQSSLSKLRTITQNNVAPGNINIGWDGRANNGMWVAPGHYTVIVKVTDSMGNTAVESRILTTIQH